MNNDKLHVIFYKNMGYQVDADNCSNGILVNKQGAQLAYVPQMIGQEIPLDKKHEIVGPSWEY